MQKTLVSLDGLKQTRRTLSNRLESLQNDLYLPQQIKDSIETRMEDLLVELDDQIQEFEKIIQFTKINQGLGL